MSSVYATVADPDKWQEFCDVIFAYTGAPILFFAHNIDADLSLGIIGGGVDPSELERYHQHFADQNPWMERNQTMPVGMVGVSEQAVARENLIKTEFYNDWLRRQDNAIGGPAMICHRDSDRLAALALCIDANRFDDLLNPSRTFLEQISPHLTRCVEMSKLLARGNGSQTGHLENARQAVILIHQSGRVANVNKAGKNLIESSRIISLTSQEHLASRNDNVRSFISKAVGAIHERSFAKIPDPLQVGVPGLGSCVFQLHVFPEDSSQGFPVSAWSDPVAGAIIISSPDGLGVTPDYSQIISAFGATKAEIRLAQALIKGQSLNDYADQNNLSRHTVRNQMRSLRLKTDSTDKTDFIRKMHNLASPFSARIK